jgi:hypothetical protein
MAGRQIHRSSSGRPDDPGCSESHITPGDFKHMKWILLDSCPAELMFIEPLDNKLAMLKCGSSKTFKDNPNLIKKAMNKED